MEKEKKKKRGRGRPSTGFDKKAYMKEYMRKKRCRMDSDMLTDGDIKKSMNDGMTPEQRETAQLHISSQRLREDIVESMGGGDVIARVDPDRWQQEPQLAYANGWNDCINARVCHLAHYGKIRGALELICSPGFEMLDVEDARAVAKSSLKWLGDGNE